MKNEFSEIVEVEKVRKKFEEVADKCLKHWVDLYTQMYGGAEFKLLDTYAKFDTCEICIEFAVMDFRMEVIFQLKQYDEESSRMDWTIVSRTLDYMSYASTYDDYEDEYEE